MTDGRTEERVREALQAVRRQSVDGAVSARSFDDAGPAGDGVSDLDGEAEPSSRGRWWLPATAAAAVVILLGAFALAGRVDERQTSVTASQSEEERAHARAVGQVTEECRRFQAARPTEPAPYEVPADLAAWIDRYQAAIDQATSAVDGIDARFDDDRAVLAETAATLARQRGALDGALAASDAGDAVEAIRLIDQARSYESIAAFELAQWGAVECDARGVTRPTR